MKKSIFIFLVLMVSCKTLKTDKILVEKNIENASVFYLFRHAEKLADHSSDPELSRKGFNSATKYANFFKNLNINAVYTTNFKRTKHTVLPISKLKNLKPIIYNPNKVDYAKFLINHKNETVLIVGHSNTTPNFANKLIGKLTYDQFMDDNYTDIIKIVIKDGEISHKIIELK